VLGPIVVKLPGKESLISLLPYWNTNNFLSFDLNPYLSQAVEIVEIEPVPPTTNISFDFKNRTFSVNSDCKPDAKFWQAVMNIHVKDKLGE
jgi:hypothetical protein